MNMNSNNEQVTFLRWWESKRILFNLIVLIGLVVLVSVTFGGFSAISSIPIKLTLVLILFINIFYALFSLIGFIFKSVIGDFDNVQLNYFFQNRSIWQFLFVINVLIALLGLFFIVIGGGSSINPVYYIH